MQLSLHCFPNIHLQADLYEYTHNQSTSTSCKKKGLFKHPPNLQLVYLLVGKRPFHGSECNSVTMAGHTLLIGEIINQLHLPQPEYD